ncbi:MAG: GSU2403 family nucleotidyltransferase fold protein [Thermoleophilia bacterium]|jgi:hypothetical protein
MADQQIEALLRALIPIRSYLTDGTLVICGGWVPIIFQRYIISEEGQPALHTADVDVVVAKSLAYEKRPSLRRLLLVDGFIEDIVGDANPPASCFRKEVGEVKIELEFLTPLSGARDHETKKIQEDLSAQALRYSDLLLEDPMPVRIVEVIDEVAEEFEFFVPRPAAFIFQKGLAVVKRKDRLKKAKDLYYIFDVLAGYPGFASEIEKGMHKFKQDRSSWFSRFVNNLTEYFLDDGATGPGMIAEQRPAGAYQTLNDAQLEQYCRRVIAEFIRSVS